MTLAEKLAFKNSLTPRTRGPMPEFLHEFEKTTDTIDTMLPTREGDVQVYIVVPKEKNPSRGLYVNIHGGGFMNPHFADDTAYCRRISTEVGCVSVDIDYGLAPEHPYPVAFHQCYDVVKYMVNHAEEYGFDPEVLMIGGNSAGGNLAAAVCLEAIRTQDFKPILAVMLYPVMDLFTDPAVKQKDETDSIIPPERARIYNLLYVDDPEMAKEPTCSPIFAPDALLAQMPPCVVYTAGEDSLKREGEEFALRLARAGVNVTCKRWPGSLHGFYFAYTPNTYRAVIEVEQAMKKAIAAKNGTLYQGIAPKE